MHYLFQSLLLRTMLFHFTHGILFVNNNDFFFTATGLFLIDRKFISLKKPISFRAIPLCLLNLLLHLFEKPGCYAGLNGGNYVWMSSGLSKYWILFFI